MSNKTIEQRIEEAWDEYKETHKPLGGAQFYYKDNREYFKAGVEFGRELERERAKVLVNSLLWIKDKAPFCDCMDAPALAKEALKAYEDGSGK